MQTETNPILEQLAFVRRRWVTILAVFVAFVSVAAVWTAQQPPVYRSSTRVLVGPDVSNGLISERSSPLEGYFLERRSFDTQLEVMKSDPVVARAAEILGRLDADSTPERREAAIAFVKGAINVVRVGDTRIVVLNARAPTPVAARDLADAMARAYIDYSNEQRDEARRQSIAWLTEETANLREELRASEERLVEYLSNEQIDPVVDDELASGSADVLGNQITAAEVDLSQLRQRYRDRHPLVVDARSRLASLTRRAHAELESRATDNRKLIHYRILKRDADLDHDMYQLLLKKLKEADVSASIADTGVRVLEVAKLPHAPIGPHTVRNLAVASILGLCLALGLAFGADSFDRTLRSAEEVHRATGMPTLAIVNRFEAEEGDRLLAAQTTGNVVGETFRALRTNVRFSHVDKPRRVVLVTSTGPEEGKSTILSNLAVSLAQSGRRTLVIDTDLRRPTLHKLFKLPNGRGLADLLAGDAELSETVAATPVEHLEVLPSGTLPPNPAELIESYSLQRLVSELRESYDYVLLDSPPAGGLIDASLLCQLADGVLFVVEAARYDHKATRTALAQLERAGAKLYGVVLNKAPREAGARYYGYYHYKTELEAPAGRAG